MALDLHEPRRKYRGYVAGRVPFPIFTEKATGIPVSDSTWRTYTGRFCGDSVVVSKLEDISALYSMGCYGKGSRSRGCSIIAREKRKQPVFLKERQWSRHKQWMEKASSTGETDSSSKALDETDKEKEDNDINCDSNEGAPGEKSAEKVAEDNSKSEEEGAKANVNVTLIDDDADSENSDIVEVDNCGKAKDNSGKRLLSPNNSAENIQSPLKRRKSISTTKSPEDANIEIVDLSSDDDPDTNPKPVSKLIQNPASSANSPSSTNETRKTNSPVPVGEPLDCTETEVVVLADIDSEDEDYFANLKPKLEHEPAYFSRENLILSLEEAMFLSYGLGCLRIEGLKGEELSLIEIWKLFQEAQRSFIQRYVAYHYFRSKGWVVKSGFRYGGDFVLYKEGPHSYHSSCVVIVEVISERTFLRDNFLNNRRMTWTQLMGLDRLSTTAGKEVLICQVVWPAKLPKERILPSPLIIPTFQVHEMLLRRWVPAQDRKESARNQDDDASLMKSSDSNAD